MIGSTPGKDSGAQAPEVTADWRLEPWDATRLQRLARLLFGPTGQEEGDDAS